jgi:hypothetical protein
MSLFRTQNSFMSAFLLSYFLTFLPRSPLPHYRSKKAPESGSSLSGVSLSCILLDALHLSP